jgi:hypothetical protein
LTDRKRPKGTMRRGSVTCLVCGLMADAGYLRGEDKAARLGTIHYEVMSEMLARVSRVS